MVHAHLLSVGVAAKVGSRPGTRLTHSHAPHHITSHHVTSHHVTSHHAGRLPAPRVARGCRARVGHGQPFRRLPLGGRLPSRATVLHGAQRLRPGSDVHCVGRRPRGHGQESLLMCNGSSCPVCAGSTSSCRVFVRHET
jgi:hypothetical protein